MLHDIWCALGTFFGCKAVSDYLFPVYITIVLARYIQFIDRRHEVVRVVQRTLTQPLGESDSSTVESEKRHILENSRELEGIAQLYREARHYGASRTTMSIAAQIQEDVLAELSAEELKVGVREENWDHFPLYDFRKTPPRVTAHSISDYLDASRRVLISRARQISPEALEIAMIGWLDPRYKVRACFARIAARVRHSLLRLKRQWWDGEDVGPDLGYWNEELQDELVRPPHPLKEIQRAAARSRSWLAHPRRSDPPASSRHV